MNNSDIYNQNCTEETRAKGSKPCAMDLTTLGECYSNDKDFQYGYDDKKPCIFFKMNRVSLSLNLIQGFWKSASTRRLLALKPDWSPLRTFS